jgi:hypothetical protein
MASPSDSLKKELLQPQNERGKLMKWKILLVSGAGSSALGFSANPAHVRFRRRDIAGIMGQHQAGVALNLMKSQIISACAYVVAGLLSQSNIPIEIWPDRRAACPAAFLWRAGRNLDGSD